MLPELDLGALIAKASKEVVFSDQLARGFVRLTLTSAEARADMVGVSTIASKDFTVSTVKSFRTRPEGTGLTGLSEV